MNPRRKKPAKKAATLKPKALERLTLPVESVAFGGDGIARLDGKVYFIADALPGQTVEVEVIMDKERFAKARAVRVLKEADSQRPAPCAYSDRCGGCQWQKAPYNLQLEWKSSFIRDAFERIGGIAQDSYSFMMRGSEAEEAYRNRIELKFQITLKGTVELGYFAQGSHDLVSISRCLIADPLINAAIPHLKKLSFKAPSRRFESSLQLQRVEADIPQLLMSGDAWTSELWRELLESLHKDPWLKGHIIHDQNTFVLLEEWQGLKFFTRAGQFQQVNLAANRWLREWVLQKAKHYQVKNAVDLYCGSGNLSLALAHGKMQVFGVEAFAPSIEAARYNRQINRLQDFAAYETGDAQDIRTLFPSLPKIDLIIVDPPRRGMAEAIDPLLGLDASLLIYVSCDPNTLARDLKKILSHGYQLLETIGMDFFPQSYHVETVCLLKKV